MRDPRPALHLPGGRRRLLELDLTRGLQEQLPAMPLAAIRARQVPTLRSVVDALERARRDEHVVGLVAHVGNRGITFAQSAELRQAVRAFAAAGKVTVAWAESFGEAGPGNVGYHLATGFDEIWLQPSGELGLTGVTARAVFVRDALDKLGVQAQISQRAEYKTAANMFLESSMTEPHREMVRRMVDSVMTTLVHDVAAARRLPEQAVRDAVDAAPLTAPEAEERGLVDRVGYRDEVYAALRDRFGEVETRFLERHRGGTAALKRRGRSAVRRTRPVVAVVHASGPIHLGHSGSSAMASRTTGSDSVGAALRAAGRDDHVRAVVLRVDSPGGSYVASDAIWREVHELRRRTGKPVVASMASVAASGGYYVSMPADVVLANSATLTGSIGVLAGKQVIRDGLARLGVRRESVSAGRFAEMFSSERPFDEDEWRRLEGWLDRIYDDFTAKAAADRGMSPERLREVAKGRVWTGADAVEIGLVDRLGGLDDAVGVACERAGVTREDAEVRTLPRAGPLDRLKPPENSDSPRVAGLPSGLPLLDRVVATMGLPGWGVLTMPVTWELR
jgi:protease-4